MDIRKFPVGALTISVAVLAACKDAALEELQHRQVTYTDDVAPILQKHCVACHSPGQQGTTATGLLLDSYAAVMEGGGFGRVVDPGAAKTSTLYNLITGDEHLTVRMPHGSEEPLGVMEIETIRVWIDNGAPEN